MLKVNNISKQFDTFSLSNISLSLDKGYILGLIGANGSGKTTLLNILCGLNQADSGNVVFDNYNLYKDSSSYKANIGFVSSDKDHGFIQNSSLTDNANIFGRFYKDYDFLLFKEYASELSLDTNKQLSRCDTSEIIKFEFAFALSHKAKLLLLDEPNGNFNETENHIFTNILRKYINDTMACAIISTHQIKDLNAIADYITMIYDGKILFSYDIETLLDSYILVKCDKVAIEHFYKEDIIYKDTTEYVISALIKNNLRVKECIKSSNNANLKTIRPSIEDIMYYLIKGGNCYE